MNNAMHHIGENLYSEQALLSNDSRRELWDGVKKCPIENLRLLCLSRGATGFLVMTR